MKVVVCLDDRLGMTFNGRRQSRDRLLCEDVLNDVRNNGGRLCISEYSRILFEESEIVAVGDDFLEVAGEGDTCFVENRELLPYVNKIQSLVIYRWNRHYPSDKTLDIDPEREGFRLICTSELIGSSHEKITKEIYER